MQPDNNQTQLLKDRLNVLPEDLKAFIASPELERKINLLKRKHNFNDDQEIILQNEIVLVLLVLDPVNKLAVNLEKSLGIRLEDAARLAIDIQDYILKKVDHYLAHSENELIVKSEDQIITEKENPNPSKEEILEGIENPKRTIVKKYVIEYDHIPIRDTSHLIDDTVDERPKLEDHNEI